MLILERSTEGAAMRRGGFSGIPVDENAILAFRVIHSSIFSLPQPRPGNGSSDIQVTILAFAQRSVVSTFGVPSLKFQPMFKMRMTSRDPIVVVRKSYLLLTTVCYFSFA